MSSDAGICEPDLPVADDGPRTVLVTHPVGPSASECGRALRMMKLDAAGVLSDTGQVLQVGDCPRIVKFSPDGRLVWVVNNPQGAQAGTRSVVVLRHDSDGQLTVASELHELSQGDPVHIAFSPDGTRAYVADHGGQGQGGVHVLQVTAGCGASYVKKIPVAIPTATQVLPGGAHALVMGGTEPVDTTVLDLAAGTVTEGFDLFPDAVGARSLALSPDGARILVPNSSAYSKAADMLTLLSLDMSAPVPVPSVASSAAVPEPASVAWSPDGTKVVVTNSSAHKVTWLEVAEGKLAEGGTIAPVELAEMTAVLRRGPHAGLVLVSSITNVRVLRFTDTGMADVSKVSLGSGHGAIIGDLSLEP
jgi:DNA-binding beta-propeller fold protein YncE